MINLKRSYCWWDSKKTIFKIAIAHHDGNNFRNYFCKCQKKLLSNQLWMKIFPWKSFCQTWNRNMNMRKKLLLMRSSKLVNENKIFSGKSLSNWNMDNIAMAIMNENTRNSFCKLKLNYCWIYCKWKETTDEKEATVEEIVYKHLIVELLGKSLSNWNMKKLRKENFAKVKHGNETIDELIVKNNL